MRFIRKEHIVTTIFNKELSDVDDVEAIRTVFNNLYDHRIEFTLIIRKMQYHIHEYMKFVFEKVRILKLHENNAVDFLVIKKGTKTRMKNIPFSNIVEVSATTRKHKILDVDDDVTRWDLLDL